MPWAQLTLLGSFRVRLPTGADLPTLPRKARALLAFLALPPGRRHERDTLATLLWGDSGDRAARHSLRQTLVLLRRVVPGVVVDGDQVGLAHDALAVDAAEFERLARRRDIASLAGAADLYAAELLGGFHVDAEPFTDWLRDERERLHAMAVEVLAALLGHHTRAGDTAEAIRVALRLLELDPLQESVHRALMRLYMRQGRRAAALAQYQTLVDRLRRELDTEPDPETRQLYQALLQRVPLAAPAAEPAAHDPVGPPLVGRDVEVLRLEALATGVRRGWSGAVLLLAEAGGGKTRMVDELLARWRDHGGRALLGRCREIQRTVPLAVWADALGSGTGPADIDRLLGTTDPRRRELGRLIPGLGDAARASETGRETRTALFDGVADALGRLAAERPLALALEDLHWADRSSLELVADVVRRRLSSPLLLVLTAREEELVDAVRLDALIHELSGEKLLECVRLRPLSPPLVSRLVTSVTGTGVSPGEIERLAERAWRISQGNPLLAIETARDGATGGPSPASGLAVPERARTLLGARLRRLSPAARHVAQLAAVIGHEIELSVIARAARLRPREAAGLVDELVRRRIFRSFGEHLEFSHEVLREIIAAEPADESAVRLHRAVALALARRADRQAPALSKRLAHHYARAGMPGRAVDWLSRYAEQSLRVFAADEAVVSIEQALVHLAAFPPSRRPRRRVELLLQLAPALAMTGRFSEILDRLLPEEPLVERERDPALAARYDFRVVLTQVVVEDEHRLAERSQRGLEAAEATGDPAALGRLLYAVSAGCFAGGRPLEGIVHARRAVEHLGRAKDGRWLALAFWVLSAHHVVAGELDAAVDAGSASTRAATEAGDTGLAGFGATSRAWAHVERLDLAEAESECRELIRNVGEPINAVTALGILGLIRLERDQPGEGIHLLEQAVGQLPKPRRELFAIPLGEAYAAAGALAGADAVAAHAEEAARSWSSPWRRGRCHRLAGAIAAARKELGEAERQLAQAARELAAVPAPLEVARTRMAAARVAAARGDGPIARSHLDAAREAYMALNLPLRIDAVQQLRTRLRTSSQLDL